MAKSKLRKFMAFVLVVLLSGIVTTGVAFADQLLSDGDGLVPINNDNALQFGSVNAGGEATNTVLLAIKRQGDATKTNQDVFENAAEVTISHYEIVGAAPASWFEITGGEVTLPENWASQSNGTLSDPISSSVKLSVPVGTGSGIYSGTIRYQAVGNKSTGGTNTITSNINFSFTVVAPAVAVPVVVILAPEDGGIYRTATLPGLSYMVDSVANDPTASIAGWSTVEGSHTVTVNKTNSAGTGSDSVDYIVDNTAPEITRGSPSGNEGENGWWTSDVTVPFIAADNLSGFAPDGDLSINLPSVVLSTEGRDQSGISEGINDRAGNYAAGESTGTFNIDKTDPTIEAGTPTGTPGDNGWWRSAVTVPFSATDNISGFDAAGTLSINLSSKATSGQGTGITVTSDGVSDWAGNNAAGITSAPFNIDWTAPTIDVNHIDGSVLPLSGNPVFHFTVTDNLSGLGYPSSGIIATLNGNSIQEDVDISLVTGVYSYNIHATDQAGNTASASGIIVVYDPSAGFVTGGGWIDSPAGASAQYPNATGKANFGFVSKYQKGANIPTGNTQFQFKAGNLNFNSTSYEWLVIAGSKAQYKGSGTINDAGDYGFMLTAIDGDLNGKKPDSFRIKIWDKTTNAVIYDNQLGASDSADPTTLLGGGSIVIHSK